MMATLGKPKHVVVKCQSVVCVNDGFHSVFTFNFTLSSVMVVTAFSHRGP